MKRFGKRFLCGLLAVCMLSAFSFASAAEEASAYLSDYSATLTAKGGGRISILVDVGGTGYMDEIGATEIYLYESTDDVDYRWVATYTSDDYPNMLDSGTDYYDAPVVYQGVAGRYYFASVYFYAGDETGSDWGHYETVSCRAT